MNLPQIAYTVDKAVPFFKIIMESTKPDETKWQDHCSEMVQADLVAVAKEQRRNAE